MTTLETLNAAAMDRAEIMHANRENATDEMHFTPHTGRCYSCKYDLIEHYGAEAMASGINVTGCPKCHRSYCD